MDRDPLADIPCGSFQAILVFLTQMTRFSTVWGLYIMMFGNYEPPWRCVLEENSDGVNPSEHLGQRAPLNSQINSNSGVKRDSPCNGSCDIISMNANSDSTHLYNGSCQIYPSCREILFEPGSSTIVTEFELVCNRAWIASFILSIKMLAFLVGSYLGGHIGERFGRRVSLYGSTGLLCASAGLGILSLNWIMYAVFCFFIGLACGGIMSTASVLSMEFLNPWWRAIFASLPMWNISQVIFVLVIIWLKNWRLIHLASAIVSGVSFLGVFWVPESLRWLDVHGKRQQANKVVKRIYTFNKLDFSHPVMERNDTSSPCISNSKMTPNSNKVDCNRNMTYLDLFRDPHVRSITIKTSIAWVTSHVAYTSMGYGIKSLPGDYYTNAIIASITEVPVILSIGPLTNRIGRRWSAVIYLCLAVVACTVLVLVHYIMEGDSKGIVITISALTAKTFVASLWCALITMAVELYPTVIRNLGYGFLNLVSGAGGVIAPYLIPQSPSWFGICFMIIIGMMILCTFVTIRLPETMNKTLTDDIKSGSNGINDTNVRDIDMAEPET